MKSDKNLCIQNHKIHQKCILFVVSQLCCSFIFFVFLTLSSYLYVVYVCLYVLSNNPISKYLTPMSLFRHAGASECANKVLNPPIILHWWENLIFQDCSNHMVCWSLPECWFANGSRGCWTRQPQLSVQHTRNAGKNLSKTLSLWNYTTK